MKTKWKVDPLWVGVFVAAAGTGIAIEGVLRFSVSIAIAGMFLSLRAQLRRQHPP